MKLANGPRKLTKPWPTNFDKFLLLSAAVLATYFGYLTVTEFWMNGKLGPLQLAVTLYFSQFVVIELIQMRRAKDRF